MSPIKTESNIDLSAEPTLEFLRAKRITSSVLALRRAQNEQNPRIKCELYEHVYDQETTHLSEVLDGVVRAEVNFTSLNNKLLALDESGPIDWEEFHQNNWQYSNLLAQQEPELRPYLKIAEAEAEEGFIQAEMVESGEPKTMVVLSLCGDDILSPAALKKIGRDPIKRRAMLRVSMFDGQKLKIYSRSIDGMGVDSARKFLNDKFGIELPASASSVDILKTRIILDGAHSQLADDLTPPQLGHDTYKFVLAQPDLLKTYIGSLENLSASNLSEAEIVYLANELRYDIMASFRKRLEGKKVYATASSIASAGNSAREEGEEFNGCDTVVSSLVNRLGYGPKAEIQRDCITCPGCSKVVNADKDYFAAGFLRCPECKLTVKYRKDARLPDKNKDSHNQNQEGFFEWWIKKKQQDKLKRQQQLIEQKSKEQIQKDQLALAV